MSRELVVMGLNVWGMSNAPDKKQRIQKIADYLASEKYDLFLLTELWSHDDHRLVRERVGQNGYYMTGYSDLGSTKLSRGIICPLYSSGLAIVSKHPFDNVEFKGFHKTGKWINMLKDGEILANKGVGKVTITLWEDFTVDVFVTHTVASWAPRGDSNDDIRENQLKQVMNQVDNSLANLVIIGGDFNTDSRKNDKAWQSLIQGENGLVDCYTEFTGNIEDTEEKRATFHNPDNSYTQTYYIGQRKMLPEMLDYILYRFQHWTQEELDGDFQVITGPQQEIRYSGGKERWKITKSFDIIKKKFKLGQNEFLEEISLSDHEIIRATLQLETENIGDDR